MRNRSAERSFWGWGWADRFPDEDGRRGLASHAAGLLGVTGLTPRPPPVLAEVVAGLPARAPIAVPADLAAFVTADPEARIRHTYGKSYRDQLRGFHGDYAAAPDLVATPRNEQEIEALLEMCGGRGIAVVPFGGGSSVVGGVEGGGAGRPVLSLDLTALDAILEVDPVSRAARLQAGLYGPALEAGLAPHGLTLRHFPQSFEFSTLGGWLATRAGGHFATLYTHIDDLTESIRMITPTGVWQSRRLPASGAGPSPDRLVLGSEGILGVITEAWMRLQAAPRWRASASVLYADFFAGARAARAVAQAGLYPSNCRLLDAREALLNGVAADGSSVLLLAFESADHAVVPWMERALALAVGEGGTCPRGAVYKERGSGEREGEGGRWRDAFLAGPYLQSALISLGVIADTFETACTWDRFTALHASVSDAVHEAMRRACGGGSLSCRFTHVYPDGPAPYFTFLAPGRAGAELEQWHIIKAAASDALLAAGATITHHHAVGRLHRPWYDRQRPDPFAAALSAAKGAVDPNGILNPGVLLPVSGST